LKKTGVSECKILKLFGSYNDLAAAAGFEPTIFLKSDDQICPKMLENGRPFEHQWAFSSSFIFSDRKSLRRDW